MNRQPTRRQFLTAAAGIVPVLAASPNPTELLELAMARGASPRADLPPRVVGLRSLGGAFRFDPPGLLIRPGDTVRWLNMGDFHTATSFHPDNGRLLPRGVPRRVPEGAEAWHSGMLGLTAGTEFQHRFRVEGVHDYFCQPHYSFGMVGRVVVGGPRGGPVVQKGDSELLEAAQQQMPSVETVTGPSGRIFEWAARVNGVLWTRIHDGDPEAAGRALVLGMRQDQQLRDVLEKSAAAGALEEPLARFGEGAETGLDYESLIQRADTLKRALESALS